MEHTAQISGNQAAPAAFDLLLGLAAPVELAAQFAGRSPDDTGLESLAMGIVESGREHDANVAARVLDLVAITRTGLEAVADLRRMNAPPPSVRAAANMLVDELAASIAVIARRI
ncbi:MAG: hypothetical protein GW859_03325 [Sphingomonadales bacterium]|nr:hypothetical protein [Sphingomonadales bacterium]